MSACEPASTPPMGAPRPLEKSSHAVSKPRVHSVVGTPLATTAFISRAPSRCSRKPLALATSTTSRSCASGHTWPPARLGGRPRGRGGVWGGVGGGGGRGAGGGAAPRRAHGGGERRRVEHPAL